MLSLRDVSVHYGQLQALRGVSVEVPQSRVVALLGANAAGKSTMLRAISGLCRISAGEIWFEGKRLDDTPCHEVVSKGIAQVPEGRRVFADMSVRDNLLMGAFSRNESEATIVGDLDEIFDLFPILKERRNGQAGFLSGGEQEMLAIGRALMARPRLLLLDEPCQGLSPMMTAEVERIIREMRARDMTIVLVEHNIKLALGVADSIYILETGRVVMQGKPDELSESDYVQRVYLAG